MSYCELVVEGDEETLRALVLGAAVGRSEPADRVIFGRDVGLDPSSLGATLKEHLLGGSHHAVVVPDGLAAAVLTALGAHGTALGLRLERQRDVATASFGFEAEAFSREVADRIRGTLIRSHPAGVHVEELSEQEETHPDAHGAEPYAPLHEYAYRASGRISGQFESVIHVLKRVRALDFVKIGPLQMRE